MNSGETLPTLQLNKAEIPTIELDGEALGLRSTSQGTWPIAAQESGITLPTDIKL